MPQNSVPTVMIADPMKPGDFAIINEADFDPKRHMLWQAPKMPEMEKRTAEAVEIPEGWREMKWFAMRALAQGLTDEKVDRKADAIAVIEAEIERRG